MEALLARNRDFADWIKRNVVGLRTSEDLFDDLSDGDPARSALAAGLEAGVKRQLAPPDPLSRAFVYSTAVEYPFRVEPWQQTRYGDGTYPVWYGSLALTTTVHETGYHMARHELGVEGLDEIVVRERAVYDVHCRALLIDMAGQRADWPALVHPTDYSFTQAVGKRVSREGHPGLLAPSARDETGTNAAVFRQNVLTDPRLSCYLRYRLDPVTGAFTAERRPGEVLVRRDFAGAAA